MTDGQEPIQESQSTLSAPAQPMFESAVPTPPQVDPVVQVAPVEPAQPPGGRSRTRWAIAGAVALLVVVLSAAGLFVLVGGSKASVVEAWAPADALFYQEIRADLPGDQHQNLGRFLAHFPGFADQSTFDQKLDETLDRLIARIGDGSHDWTKDIKPWFGGEIGISISSLPTTAAEAAQARVLLVATQKDPVAAGAWFSSLSPTKAATETYKGVTLSTFPSTGGPSLAMAATAGVLLVGDLASVRAAIDRNGAGGLATRQSFRDAMAAIDGDQVARTYVDLKGILDTVLGMVGSQGLTAAGFDRSMLDRLPSWASVGGRVETDALVSRWVAPHVPGTTGASIVTNAASAIAGRLPASTLALIETHGVGGGLLTTLAQLKKDPQLAPSLTQVEQAAGMLGGLDKLIGWIGDVGIVVTADRGTPSGGLVIVPTDAAQADAVFTQLKNLASLAGQAVGITVSDAPYGDGTITTIDLGDAARLLGEAGGGSPAPLPLNGRVQIAFTVQRGLAVIGGDAFVKAVLDVRSGASLGDQARYKGAMDRVGATNMGSVFVDIAAVRSMVEPLVSALPGAAGYATQTKPYLAPFDVLAFAAQVGDKLDRATVILTITNP
jgi:hypothetical protein